MDTLYDRNGLVFWTEKEIRQRQMFVDYFVNNLRDALKAENRSFELMQIEAPILTPVEFLNKNYTPADYFDTQDKGHCPDAASGSYMALRPETTMGSYQYAKWLLEHTETKTRLPICVWQHGKSFRREQDQVVKNMRLKEFYQLEFQCIYGLTTANDYSLKIIPAVQKMISDMIGPCHTEKSDRLPDYSEETTDVVCTANGMEVCSISKRKDFPNAKVLEVAIGTDRCVYNFFQRINNG
jgi:glycyl-tRNA synthetase